MRRRFSGCSSAFSKKTSKFSSWPKPDSSAPKPPSSAPKPPSFIMLSPTSSGIEMPTIASSSIANDICGRGWQHTQPSVGGSSADQRRGRAPPAGAGWVLHAAHLRRHEVRVEVQLVEVLGVGDVIIASGRGAGRHVNAARPAEGVLDLDHRLRAVGEQVGDLA